MRGNLKVFVIELKSGKKSHLYTAILFVTLFAVYQYGIHQIYGMSEYPDEFGYWSTAADMIGWDWSQIASRGSYYSFGYSFILCPILKFCKDSVSAYRTAVLVNFSCMVVSFFLLKGIYKRIFTVRVEGEEIPAIGLSMLYPAWSFYAQTTMVDSMLIFMVILICYLWVRFIRDNKLKWGSLLVTAVIYNYTLHMRSIGILVAVILVLMLWVWRNPIYWRKIFLLFSVIIVFFFTVGWIKGIVQRNVFVAADIDRLNANDFGGQWSKIEFLFSLEGLKQLFFITMGKVLYLGIAGMGLVYVAFIWCGKQAYDWWKESVLFRKLTDVSKNTDIGNKDAGWADKSQIREWFGLLLMLMMFGQLTVCLIYTIHTQNVDWLIYGRYIEAFIPMAVFVGAGSILQKSPTHKLWLGCLVIYTLAAVSCIYKVWGQTKGHIRGEHSVATIFLIGDGNVNPMLFFMKVWLAGMIIMIFLGILLSVLRKEIFSVGIMTVLCVIMAAWSIYGSEQYTYIANDHMFEELILVNVLEEQLAEGKEIYYLEENNTHWISYVQMQLREHSLSVITIEELKKIDSAASAVLVDGATEYLEYMEGNYNRKVAGFYHYVFYNN